MKSETLNLILVAVAGLILFGMVRSQMGDDDDDDDGNPNGRLQRSDLDDYPKAWILAEAREINAERNPPRNTNPPRNPTPANPVRNARRAVA